MREMLENGLYDIYGIMYRPFWQRPFFVYGLGALFFLILLLGVWGLVKRFKKQKTISHEERALVALQQVEKDFLSGALTAKECYVQFSFILKRYFFDQHQLGKPGMTDKQFLEYLHAFYGNTSEVSLLFASMLDGMTLIKFAEKAVVQQQVLADSEKCRTCITLVCSVG